MIPSCPHDQQRPNRLRDALLWGTAALVMFSAHVSSAAWLLRQAPEEMADNGPPPAIMIEMAPEPEAVATDTSQLSEDTQDSQEVASLTPPVEDPPVEPLPPEPQPEPEPVEEMTNTIPEPEPLPEPVIEEPAPIEQEMVKLMENVEVPLPAARPEPVKPEVKEPPKPKKVERKEKPKEQAKPKPPAPAKAAMAAAAEVDQGARNAASQSSSGSSFSSVSPARWQSKVQAHLARRKKQLVKTREKGEQGTVLVRFNIDTGGNVLSVSLSRSSGHPGLDQDVLAMVRSASPVPAPPPDVNRTLTVPIEFTSR